MNALQASIQRYVRRFNILLDVDGTRISEREAIDQLSKGAKYEQLCSRLVISQTA